MFPNGLDPRFHFPASRPGLTNGIKAACWQYSKNPDTQLGDYVSEQETGNMYSKQSQSWQEPNV